MDGRQLIYKLSCEKKKKNIIKNERINKPEKINEPVGGLKQFMAVLKMWSKQMIVSQSG